MKNSKTFVINSPSARKEAVMAVSSITRGPPIMTVTIEPYKRDRSNDQNKAYWKVLLEPIEKATGEEAKLWHELFKKLFAKTKMITVHGYIFETKATTTDMTTEEFSEYMESIRRWASENLNMVLPEIDSSKKEK